MVQRGRYEERFGLFVTKRKREGSAYEAVNVWSHYMETLYGEDIGPEAGRGNVGGLWITRGYVEILDQLNKSRAYWAACLW